MSGTKRTSISQAKRSAGLLALSSLAGLGLPIVELPFLAHALGIEKFGALLFIQALALTASTFVEYGFYYSAARTIANAGNDNSIYRRTVVDVTMAKALIFFAVLCVILPLSFLTSHSQVPYGIAYTALFVASFGFSPSWYYLGKGRLLFPAAFDLAVRILGLALIIVCVRTPDHVVIALTIQCAVGLINTAVPTVVMVKQTGWERPRLSRSVSIIREGWHFFVYKGAIGISSSVATTVLGLSSTAAQVGLFSPAEKLIRAGSSFASAVLSAFFSLAVSDFQTNKVAYKTKLFRHLVPLFGLLVVGAAVVSILSYPIVRILFGDAFLPGAPLLQAMIFLMPFRVTSSALSILWVIPSGNEALLSRFALWNIIFVLTAGLITGHLAGAVGMAVVVGLGEIGFFTCALCAVVYAPVRTQHVIE
jgi:polysaccharide transporter, PST family